ncbi:MAG: glutamate racemase [Elusimicrobia bacterium]|nr:glutamate racemase [Elusimicrobiota bacterium]
MNRSSDRRPIGVFDSGVGGLTVVRALWRILPGQDIIYFGDMARLPYGSKSGEAVTRFSLEIANFLRRRGVKMILVACNTASAYALGTLQRRFRLPVLGVIGPGAKAAAQAYPRGRIGVVGTSGTVHSRSFQKALRRYASGSKVRAVACPLLVPLVEEGWWRGPVTETVARGYLQPFRGWRPDALILGCTHYPLLRGLFGKILGRRVFLIDPGERMVQRAREILKGAGWKRAGRRRGRTQFYVSDNPEQFRRLGGRFLGKKIGKVYLKRF